MTLRRYAPLALIVLAAACKPDIEQRTNTATADYVQFSPATSEIPLPNDIALAQFDAFLSGGALQDASCSVAAASATTGAEAQKLIALCAYDRAGGWPIDYGDATLSFVRGTLASTGAVYAPPPEGEALDETTLVSAATLGGPQPTNPNIALFDITNPASIAVVPVTPSFDPATGVLSIAPPGGGDWTAGKKYVLVVRGGVNGPKTLQDTPYLAMPTFYILREAVITDSSLLVPDNAGLVPGTGEAKAASAAALEKLRVGFKQVQGLIAGVAANTCPVPNPACLDIPFDELALIQTFKFAPGGVVTLGNGTPATSTATTGQVGLVDAFTLDSSLSSATIAGVAFALAAGNDLVSDLSLRAAADCSGPTLGRIASPAAGLNTFSLLDGSLSTLPNVRADATTNLYVCATTTGAGVVSGAVAAVVPLTGTGFTVEGTDDAGTLTVSAP